MNDDIDPRMLVLSPKLIAYRGDFDSYVRLIVGKEEEVVDLDVLQAWKLLQILLYDLDWLAKKVHGNLVALDAFDVEPRYRCLDPDCENCVTDDTSWNGYCAVHKKQAEEDWS